MQNWIRNLNFFFKLNLLKQLNKHLKKFSNFARLWLNTETLSTLFTQFFVVILLTGEINAKLPPKRDWKMLKNCMMMKIGKSPQLFVNNFEKF